MSQGTEDIADRSGAFWSDEAVLRFQLLENIRSELD
jgi:hypothetical protein